MNILAKPLNDAEMDQLDDFLLHRIPRDELLSHLDRGVLCISELHGYFTAVATVPKLIQTEQWLPHIWGDFSPEWQNETHASAMLELLRRFKYEVTESLRTPGFIFDPCFNERTENGKTEVLVRDWCNGYLRGSLFLPAEGNFINDPEFSSPTMVIKANTLIEGIDVLKLMEEKDPAGAQRIRTSVPDAARDLYRYWADARTAPGKPKPQASAILTGRNDLCPCGSGKKFKRCCLH